MATSSTPEMTYRAYLSFKKTYLKINTIAMNMSTAFIDAYKGVGAYYTMKNMILFHGCVFNDMTKDESMAYLKDKAKKYSKSAGGWRLFGLMKKLIADNNIDIQKKMAEWRKNQ